MKSAALRALAGVWDSDHKYVSLPNRLKYIKQQLGDDAESPFVWEYWDPDPEVRLPPFFCS